MNNLSLGFVADWASIIGLVLTGLTFYFVFGLKEKFLLKSGVDAHIKSLIEISSEVSGLLQSYEANSTAIDELFELANVELRAIQRGADGDLLSDIKKARRLIFVYDVKILFYLVKNEKSARRIKMKLSVVTAELENFKKSLFIGD